MYTVENSGDSAALASVAIDLKAEYNLASLAIKGMLVVTWYQLENPGNDKQVMNPNDFYVKLYLLGQFCAPI